MRIKLRKMDPDAKMPEYATPDASGADVFCLEEVNFSRDGCPIIVGTGLQVAYIEPGYEIQVRSKSGLSSKGYVVANSPGTIDSDYRGEIKVILCKTLKTEGHKGYRCTTTTDIYIEPKDEVLPKGSKIAQLVVVPVKQATFEISEEVTETKRGANGFGSTGI